MTHSIPDYLKIHIEETPVLPPLQAVAEDELSRLSRALLDATGWAVTYQKHEANSPAHQQVPPPGTIAIPVHGEAQELLGEFVLQPQDEAATHRSHLDLGRTRQLVTAVSELVSMLEQARVTIWKQEAHLATAIPVSTRKDEQDHLADRLEAILRCGGEAVGGQAAAAYLLDEDTQNLKMRSSWGLPVERLLDPARPLQGATVDLEALVGHAVSLRDPAAMPAHLSAHQFQSAICVPISSPTVPLGTLWIFNAEDRTFDQHQSNLAELVAGRISAELEREVLLQQTVDTCQQEREWQHAAAWQENRLPRNPFKLKHWEVAGMTDQAGPLGGDFYDWNLLDENRLAIMLGDAAGSTIEAALTAATVQASIRADLETTSQPGCLLNQANHMLWTGCTGDQFASLFAVMLNPATGKLEYSAVGDVAGLLLHEDSFRWLPGNPLSLGTQETSEYETVVEHMHTGDTLVLFSEGLVAAHRQQSPSMIEESLVNLLREHPGASAEELVQILKQWGDVPERSLSEEDQTVIVVRRTGAPG